MQVNTVYGRKGAAPAGAGYGTFGAQVAFAAVVLGGYLMIAVRSV